MDDDNKPVTGDWNDAARKTEESWNKAPGQARNAPDQSLEDSLERTEEGYGSGKDGANPGTDDDGRTPPNPAG